MNRKQLTLLLVLVVVVGAAGLYIYNSQNQARRGGNPTIGKKLLPDLPVNDITAIHIKQGTNELQLAKAENIWRVQQRDDYPANYQEISDFLLKARDLKVVQTEKVGSSQLPRLQLVPGDGTNSATVVEFRDKSGKPTQTLLLGKKHMRKSNRPSPMGDFGGDEGWPDGRYVKTAAQSDSVALISDPLSNVEPRPEQWLDKSFFKVEKIRAISATFPQDTNSWQLSRETESGEWKLANPGAGEQLDTAKTSALSGALASPSFNDVAPSSKAQDLVANPTVVKIDTFENISYTLKVGQKTNETYPVIVEVAGNAPEQRTPAKDEKPEDKEKLDKEFKDKQQKLSERIEQEKQLSKWVYFVPSWTLDSILKDRSHWMAEKKPESPAGTPGSPTPPVGVPMEHSDDDGHDHSLTNALGPQ